MSENDMFYDGQKLKALLFCSSEITANENIKITVVMESEQAANVPWALVVDLKAKRSWKWNLALLEGVEL